MTHRKLIPPIASCPSSSPTVPVLLAIPALALALLPLGACARPATAAPEAEAAIPVRVAAVEWARRTPPIRAVGTLAGKEEVRLSFKVGGIVERIFVDEGATVVAGQRLATLKRPEIDAGVTQARRGLEKAERDRARVADLFAGKAATLEQVQNATTAVDVARAALGAATFNEEHATIVAPARGQILRRLVEKDELCAPGAPVLVLRASGRGWVVRAGISDRDVMRVALGDPASLVFGALPARSFDATVSEIAESASAGTGSYEIELRVDAAGAPLRSGLIARAAIRPAARMTYAFVPLEALQEGDGDGAAVLVAGGTPGRPTAVRKAVVVDHIEGDRAAIRAGLEGVAAVVTDGASRLSPGAAMQILPAEVRAAVSADVNTDLDASLGAAVRP